MQRAGLWLPVGFLRADFEEVFGMTTGGVTRVSAIFLVVSLLTGCDGNSMFGRSSPGVYKGKPDVHREMDLEQRRNQLRKRVHATQGVSPWASGL